MPIQVLVRLGRRLDSGGGGGGSLGARAGRGHPFSRLDADFLQENGSAEQLTQICHYREVELTAPCH